MLPLYRGTFYRYVGTHFQEVKEIWLRDASMPSYRPVI